MNRRAFLAAAGGSLGLAVPARPADSKQMIIELLHLRMRNTPDNMVQRTNEFFGKSWLPAMQRAGVTPVGAFTSLIGEGSPFLLLVSQYPTLAAWETSREKLMVDSEYSKARDGYYAGPLQYVRADVTLLRGFPTMPAIEVPPALSDKRSRIFELRTYESNNRKTLARKVKMFDEGEIAVFRKVNITPVFFGETLAGQNMPNLTYMVAYDDLAAREKAWTAFGSHPEWVKMRGQPGVSDGEIVSNISNSIVRPLPFSGIR